MTQTQLNFEAIPTSADQRFKVFHQQNPSVYRALTSMARELVKKGHGRIGMLFEVLRWQSMLQTVDQGGFKLNNNYRSRYARLIMETERDLENVFEIRRLET